MPPSPYNHDALPPGSDVLSTPSHRFRIERVLGQGGFGITYQAVCLQDFTLEYCEGVKVRAGDKLAIKECFPRDYVCRRGNSVRLKPDYRGYELMLEEQHKLFLDEAQTLAALYGAYRNDNIVSVYHFGEIEHDNIAFFVMPLLEGGSLASCAGNLSPARVADILYQLLQALAICHTLEQPLLHLDIKPENIMMTRREGRMIPVLIDFGLSRQVVAEEVDVRGLTLGYAPWEQSCAEYRSYVGPCTDVYALGATLYTLITGERPPSYEKRPYGNEAGHDDYQPLHLRPELRDRFCSANPEEGRRLLWSIDVALNPDMFNAYELQGETLPSRWSDAAVWLQGAFPNGPWPIPSEEFSELRSGPKPQNKLFLKWLAAAIGLLLSVASAAAYVHMQSATDPGFQANAFTSYDEETAVADTSDSAQTITESASDEEPPIWKQSHGDLSEEKPAEEKPAEEKPAKMTCVALEGGKMVLRNAGDARWLLDQWRTWADKDNFDKDFQASSNKPQTLLKLIYAWKNSENEYHNNQLKTRLSERVEATPTDTADLKMVKAYYFYLKDAQGEEWKHLFNNAESPTSSVSDSIAQYLFAIISHDLRAKLATITYRWNGSRITCTASNIHQLAIQITHSMLKYERNDLARANMLAALVCASQSEERARSLLDGVMDYKLLYNSHLLLCYHRFRTGRDWMEDFREMQNDRGFNIRDRFVPFAAVLYHAYTTNGKLPSRSFSTPNRKATPASRQSRGYLIEM